MSDHTVYVDETFTINKTEFYEYEARLLFEEIPVIEGLEGTSISYDVEITLGDRWQDHVTFPFYGLEDPDQFEKFNDFVARLVAFKEQVERQMHNG